MKKLFVVILLAIFSNSYSQTLDFLPKGLGLEVGLGSNQLKFQDLPVAPLFISKSYSRNEFKLTPTIRLSFEKEVISNFSLMPFISYSTTGGKSNVFANGYEDEYILKTLDLGLFASYRFYNISFSAGGKYNRFLDITDRYYGSSNDPAGTNRVWNEADMSFLFKKWAFDLGGRVSYRYYHFTTAVEGWFSVSDLINKEFGNDVNISSSRFQLLIGYQL